MDLVSKLASQSNSSPSYTRPPHQPAIADSKSVNWQSSPVIPENDDVPF